MSSFPQKIKSTVSHWQATNRGPDTLYDHGRDCALPKEEVDYVIIGGGMTGASLAYAMSRDGISPGKKIVLLEAKDVASGASGRNGGHVAPWSFANYSRVILPLKEGGAGISKEEGLDVLQLERENLAYVQRTVEEEGWDVDFWKGEKIEVAVTDREVDRMRAAYKLWTGDMAASDKYRDVKPDWAWIDDPVEAEKISRISGTKAISRGPAGSIHPHKLATHFLRAALASGQVELFSWTPVRKFEPASAVGETKASPASGTSLHNAQGPRAWEVDCGDRGVIRAKQVIVCTNAHTRHLFPGEPVDKHLTPYQAQAANITPPPAYSGANALKHTIVAERGPYLIQTPHAGLVMGLGEDTGFDLGLSKKGDIYENTDDSYVKPAHQKWLAEYCKKNFIGWGEEAPGEGSVRSWSGIICASRDLLPLVGEVPEKEGLWVAVGFHGIADTSAESPVPLMTLAAMDRLAWHPVYLGESLIAGHGMARIPQTTRCLAQTLSTGEWDGRLPASYKITKERLDRGQTAPPFITQREMGKGGWFGQKEEASLTR